MLEIYRPYSSHIKTSFCLSAKDLSLMKHNSRTVVMAICEMCDWADGAGTSKIYASDPFVKFYYNDGNPDLDFLLDYYYAMHLALKKCCGERLDLLRQQVDYSKAYELHKKECSKISWAEGTAVLHRKYLLNTDRFWYKRHFQDCNGHTAKVEIHRNGEVIIAEEPR